MIFGVGVDIVDIARIARLLKKYPSFPDRILHKSEVGRSPDYVAGRWAGKEAIAKAIGSGLNHNCRMSEMSILNNQSGRPYVSLYGATEAQLNAICPGYSIFISIAHDNYAIAYCVITMPDRGCLS